jgi:hypothetical protein
LLDYETDSFRGVLLAAGQNTAAPELSYPLNRQGWHAVYIGMLSYGGGEESTKVLIRFKNDSTFALMSHHPDAKTANRIDDVFWKYADLTKQEIVFRQLRKQLVPDDPSSIANRCSPTWLAYIKLIPLSESEVRALESERRKSQTRCLFAHNDAWSYTFEFRPTSEAEIRREIEPFRDTDFQRIYWEGGMGDRMSYPTKIGLMPTQEGSDDFYRVGDRLAAESWRILSKKDIDPFRVALDYAHEIGLEFHAAYRPAGFHSPPPFEDSNLGGYYEKHPDWRSIDRLGRPTPRLSYAFPEVRRFVISLFREMAAYAIDGICLAYNRRPPLIEYEPPVVEGFRSRYGNDPRSLDERDPQWLSFRATFLTQFMREVRQAMNEVAQKQKRNRMLEISAIVMSSEQENLYYGMDLRDWIDQGLVDTIIPYTSVKRLASAADSWLDPADAKFFLQITKGKACKLALNLMPREIGPEEYRRRAHLLYQAGVRYLFFWDTNARNDFRRSWDVLRRLGHRDEIEEWVSRGSPPLDRPGSNLRKVGDWDLAYETPG